MNTAQETRLKVAAQDFLRIIARGDGAEERTEAALSALHYEVRTAWLAWQHQARANARKNARHFAA